MSDSAVTDVRHHPEEEYAAGSGVEHEHPGAGEYVRIAVILAVITAAEVAIYYIGSLNKHALTVMLLVLSACKFALVALFFMHLKFDNRIFSTFFVAGLVMTGLAFVAVLAMFRVF
jgi:cytochrome c oxidase subunit 4